MAITIRLLQDQESHLANSFFNQVYQTNRSIENFSWEFINGPCGKAIYVIAIDDDSSTTKVVGIQCAIPIELISSDGKIVLTAKSEDTLVDPSYRGQKIFERMYELLFEECRKAGIKYIWGFTPAQKAFERIGFEIPFKTEQALIVFKPAGAYQYLKSLNAKNTGKDKLKVFGLTVVSWLKGLFNFTRQAEITEVPIDSKNEFFRKFYHNQTYYALNENEAYVKWRIYDNPFHNTYKCYQWKIEQEVVADVIINLREKVSYLEQLYLKPGVHPEPLLAAIAKKCADQHSSLLRAFCFRTNEALKAQGEALSNSGFTYLKRGSYFVWKSLDQEELIKPNQLIINRLFTQGNL